ncbi:Receptor-like serine/threonine-protein kinase SD1-8 [Hordeum vulgare]|nr:Receptor-like serine/threonine-protein kinase SD1-8 [Hordeum vulgare]
MKLPEATNAMVHTGMILDRCRQLCLGTCSCRAYAAADVSGGINRGCIVWAVDLIDMRQYPEVVQDVYICLAQSEVDAWTAAANRRRSHVVLVITVVTTISGVLLLGAFAFGCLCFSRNRADYSWVPRIHYYPCRHWEELDPSVGARPPPTRRLSNSFLNSSFLNNSFRGKPLRSSPIS